MNFYSRNLNTKNHPLSQIHYIHLQIILNIAQLHAIDNNPIKSLNRSLIESNSDTSFEKSRLVTVHVHDSN